jgi:predicted O-methyltransferase YrrM
MNLKIILNDIVIHQRKNIVELGAGISTAYIAALLRKNKIDANFTTIEENEQWGDCLIN